MSTLDTLIANLQTIHSEVMNKVVPENIKAGVTIFGITGTYSDSVKTVSQAEVDVITTKLPTLNEVLIELGIITDPTSIDTLGYTCSNIDTTNNSIDITVTSLDTYTIDGDDVVYDSNGNQIYPVVE